MLPRASLEHLELLLDLCLEHPDWDESKLAERLQDMDMPASWDDVARLLAGHPLRDPHNRWLVLEEGYRQDRDLLNPEQIRFIERHNPAFAEYGQESSQPGELLLADITYFGALKKSRGMYLRVLLDTYGSLVFGRLGESLDDPRLAISLLHRARTGFYRRRGFRVKTIIAPNTGDYLRDLEDLYGVYLRLAGIKHISESQMQIRSRGLLRRFESTLKREFFPEWGQPRGYRSLETIQRMLDEWLKFYNTGRPFLGYPNMGKTPLEMVEQNLKARATK